MTTEFQTFNTINPMIETLQRFENTNPSEEKNASLDPRVLSSVIVALKLEPMVEDNSGNRDPHEYLLELIHTPQVKALLDAAQIFSERQGTLPQEGLQQILGTLKELDSLWNKILIKEGVARLSSQFH